VRVGYHQFTDSSLAWSGDRCACWTNKEPSFDWVTLGRILGGAGLGVIRTLVPAAKRSTAQQYSPDRLVATYQSVARLQLNSQRVD
jgi:hypothetical protein